MRAFLAWWLGVATVVCGADQLLISEIMYDPSGADSDFEWIEVYNPSRWPVDIAEYRFREANTSHHVGNAIVPGRGFLIIAANRDRFIDRYPDLETNCVDSVFSLSNSGELLELLSGENYPDDLIASVTYQVPGDFAGTGVSLHLDLEVAPTSATQAVWSAFWRQSSTNDVFSSVYSGDVANPGTARWVAEAADRGMVVIIR